MQLIEGQNVSVFKKKENLNIRKNVKLKYTFKYIIICILWKEKYLS